MRVDRSLYHRLRAPLLSMVICAVNSARCFASFKDMFYALFTFRAE